MIYSYCSTLELMKCHKIILGIPLISVIIWTACSSANNAGQSVAKKFFVKPVALSLSGIEKNISIRLLFEEAFRNRNVELITREEILIAVESEARKIGARLKQSGRKFKDAEEFVTTYMSEMKYVANLLSISLTLENKDDSLIIYKAIWSNMPAPINTKRIEFTKSKEINLSNLSYSLRENVYSIVDSILYSKELK